MVSLAHHERGKAPMMQREMSLRRRFLLILVACAVLPLVIVSMVSYRGLMTYDMTVQKHITKTKQILDQASRKDRMELKAELSAMEQKLLNLSHRTRTILILSSVLSIAVIVVVGAFLAKSIAGEKEISDAEEPDHKATADLSDQLEEMRKKLGNLISDENLDDS